MKFQQFFLAIIVTLIINGCDKVFNKPDEVSKLDISDTKYIGIDPGVFYLNPDNETGTNLVKLDLDSLEEDFISIDFLDNYDSPIDVNFIYAESDPPIVIAEDYIILYGSFKFEISGEETNSNALLVNVETGAIHDLVSNFVPRAGNRYLGSRYYQQDKKGNVYYLGGGVKRIMLEDPSNITVEQYTDYWEGFNEEGYFVDQSGNLFFNNGQQVKLATGGIIETGCTLIGFNGFNGKTYAFQSDYEDMNVLEFSFEDGEMNKKIVAPTRFAIYETTNYINYYALESEKQHYFFSRVIFIYGDPLDEEVPIGLMYDEDDEQVYPIYRKTPELHGEFLGIEDDHLWVNEFSNGIVSYDLRELKKNDDSKSYNLDKRERTIIPSDYNISQIRFNESAIVQFEAYNMVEEVRIQGYISVADGLFVFEQKYQGQTVDIARIR